MTNKKWFDASQAALYLNCSVRDFYALKKANEFRLRDHLTQAGGKMMISREGVLLLMN
jgi:hypothetical protein